MSTHYAFQSHWRLRASSEAVFDILHDATSFPRWWPSVYLAAEMLEPGEADGRGKVVAVLSKGWLPYTLRWTVRATSVDRPSRIAIEAFGDFVGTGVWEIRQAGDDVEVTFDWRIDVTSSWMKAGSFIVRPAFEANHRWAMARGAESLALEVRRRAASTDAERDRVPSPPHGSSRLGVTLLLCSPLIVILAWWLWH